MPDGSGSVANTPIVCPACGGTKYRNSQLCRKCHSARSVGPANPGWKGGKVSLACKNCETQFLRFPSQRSEFCSRACRNSYGLVDVTCAWPDCETTMRARACTNKKLGEVYKTELTRSGQYYKHPICQHHRERFKIYSAGSHSNQSFNAFWKIVRGEKTPRAGRSVSRMLAFIVWERQDGKCAQCDSAFEFGARRQRADAPERFTWEIDHVIPVFEGGATIPANLQALCSICHDEKSREEKSRASKSRHDRVAAGYRTTNYEKSAKIKQLVAENEELKRAVIVLLAVLNAQRSTCRS